MKTDEDRAVLGSADFVPRRGKGFDEFERGPVPFDVGRIDQTPGPCDPVFDWVEPVIKLVEKQMSHRKVCADPASHGLLVAIVDRSRNVQRAKLTDREIGAGAR